MTDYKEKFLTAISAGDEQTAKVLLAADPQLIHVPTEIGVSVILLCAYYGYAELANHLADHKTPLDIFETAATGRTSTVAKLLDAQPSLLNSFATDGFTPLGLAVFFGHEDLVRSLLNRGADPSLPSTNAMQVTPLHSAAARKRTAIAKILLEAGAEVNATQSNGVTALHSAAHNGNEALVEILLAGGAKKEMQTAEGKSAKDFAIEAGFEKIALLFLLLL